MGLSYEAACQLGIAHEHPDHPARRVDQPPPTKVRMPTMNAKGQNKTEARFDAILTDRVLRGDIRSYAFEAVKLRLAGRTWYTPDFAVFRWDGALLLIEVKGFMRDDAAVKIKTAASLYPHMTFLLAMTDGRRRFEFRPVTARGGIGKPLVTEWWHV